MSDAAAREKSIDAPRDVLSEREIEALPTEELMRLYKATGEQAYQWPLVLRYEGLIKSIALQVCGVYSGFAQVDDIVNEGIITLMTSLDKYDPELGVKFETYAAKRIRGMIVDLARRQDWLPRGVRRRAREIDQTVSELSNRLGRFPSDQEIADALGVSVEKYREDAAAAALCSVVSLEAIFERRGGDDTTLALPAGEADSPEGSVQRGELREELAAGIRTLRENERLVLSLYYERGLNMRAIAQVLEVSEPRVSQIHSRAIQKLRAYLDPYMGTEPPKKQRR